MWGYYLIRPTSRVTRVLTEICKCFGEHQKYEQIWTSLALITVHLSNSAQVRKNTAIPRQRANSVARLEIRRSAKNWAVGPIHMTLNGYITLNSVFALVRLGQCDFRKQLRKNKYRCTYTISDYHVVSSFWKYKVYCGYSHRFSREALNVWDRASKLLFHAALS